MDREASELDAAWPPPVRKGSMIDNCRVDSSLGTGGFGAVYLAYHLGLEQLRALKVLLPRRERSEELKGRFLKEARHTAKLSHANIVIVHNVGDFEGMPFINMEYVSGCSLRKVSKKGFIPSEQLVRITEQLLRALAWAHGKGYVHRDIKPDNVMVNDDGIVKLVDFGLSLNIVANTSRLTVDSGKPMGTPLYMAPEQWQGASVGPPADVWSVGVLLYELLGGVRPFEGGSLYELMHNIGQRPHVPLHVLSSTIPRPVSDLVDRMLAKSADERPADAGQALAAFAAVKSAWNELLLSCHLSTTTALSVKLRREPPAEGLVPLLLEEAGVTRFRRSCDQASMTLLPGGEFWMGSEGGDADERPRRRVLLSPFLLDEAPVTRRQYASFLNLWGSERDDAGHLLLECELAGLERAGNLWEPEGEETAPLTGVTWYGAQAYARWAGMQLPSEAQMEYVFGLLRVADEDFTKGLQLLIGSVRHWCADAYDEHFYARHSGRDPRNEDAGPFVCLRGISKLLLGQDWSLSSRQFAAPHQLMLDVGFRCVFTIVAGAF